MPSGSYDRQRFASHNPAHPSTWVRVCVLDLERLWRSQFLRLSEPAFGLPAASHVQQQRRRTPTQAQGRLWSDNQIKPNSLFTSPAPLPNHRRLLKTLPQPVDAFGLPHTGPDQRTRTMRPSVLLLRGLTASATWSKDRVRHTGLRRRCEATLKRRSASLCPLGATIVGTYPALAPRVADVDTSLTEVNLPPCHTTPATTERSPAT